MNNDLISRKALIEELEILKCSVNCNDNIDLCITAVENAQPIPNEYMRGYEAAEREYKRTTGEWIIDGHHIRCNRCYEYICNTDREGNEIPDNFCPNCGAQMKIREEV